MDKDQDRTLAEMAVEQRKKIRDQQPFYRILLPQRAKILALLSQPEAEILLQYLYEVKQINIQRLITGPKDKNGNDASDVFRGIIVGINEVIGIRDALTNYKESSTEE